MNAGERAQLAERHLDVAQRAAKLVYARVHKHMELAELVSIANTALVEAAHRYEAGKGATFSTYAWYRVHGALIDSVRRATNVSRRAWGKLLALRNASEYLEHCSDREAGAALAGAPERNRVEALRKLKDAMATVRTVYVVSLAALEESDEPATGTRGADEQLATVALAKKLKAALARLPERERKLVEKRYFEGKDLDAAGAEIGISKSWASRLHARAMELLRDELADDG